MPPRITRVRWSAENIPWGLAFDENTGVFSGKPEDVGEYIVPVTVETNYGTDSKDVLIKVASLNPPAPTYGVYAIGSTAKKWSNDITPDDDGFYKLPIPNMSKLANWSNGFCAYSHGGDIYRVGLNHEKSTSSSRKYYETPTKAGMYSDVSEIECVTLGKLDYCNYAAPKEIGVIPFITLSEGKTLYLPAELENVPRYVHVLDYGFLPYQNHREMAVYSFHPDGLRWISEDSTNISTLNWYIKTSPTAKSFNKDTIIKNVDLGYKAVKIIKPMSDGYAPFEFLSEDGLLDNNPENFPYGKIKDAWGFTATDRAISSGTQRTRSHTYVQTVNNELYYNSQFFFYDEIDTNYTWSLLGIYDIKKGMVFGNAGGSTVFFLTNDGKLYHNGSPLRETVGTQSVYRVPTHQKLTQIFPERTFEDFTFSGETLTVLME